MNNDYKERFAGIQRLYGKGSLEVISQMRVCVIGIGGVGSWVAEALARSGVGHITLIDYDTISIGNTNRQLHTRVDTVNQKKSAVMIERMQAINPVGDFTDIDDFLTDRNIMDYLSLERHYDYVVDAIDSIKFKANIIYHCRRNKIPVITIGGAGGLDDPSQIKVVDLSRTHNDALAAKVRKRLRDDFGFTRNPKRYFRVECVFSSQQQVYPRADGHVSHEKPGIHGVSLDCNRGYGSASFVTASFGFMAVSRVIRRTLDRHQIVVK
ncbi:MAG: tRNA cyclic N6-threonylcarbamoyladenosine(37) synthase TcdA [Gammaproteobacteria bacterium]|nr:tRNA cyclic N6-threonylcarbamoyladenosine(37) synthase TcdA [Gammaproteobacteria bacterium]